METKFLKPREGFKIPDPALRDLLPANGREVAFTVYWASLLRDGDVVETTPGPLDGPDPQRVTAKAKK